RPRFTSAPERNAHDDVASTRHALDRVDNPRVSSAHVVRFVLSFWPEPIPSRMALEYAGCSSGASIVAACERAGSPILRTVPYLSCRLRTVGRHRNASAMALFHVRCDSHWRRNEFRD